MFDTLSRGMRSALARELGSGPRVWKAEFSQVDVDLIDIAAKKIGVTREQALGIAIDLINGAGCIIAGEIKEPRNWIDTVKRIAETGSHFAPKCSDIAADETDYGTPNRNALHSFKAREDVLSQQRGPLLGIDPKHIPALGSMLLGKAMASRGLLSQDIIRKADGTPMTDAGELLDDAVAAIKDIDDEKPSGESNCQHKADGEPPIKELSEIQCRLLTIFRDYPVGDFAKDIIGSRDLFELHAAGIQKISDLLDKQKSAKKILSSDRFNQVYRKLREVGYDVKRTDAEERADSR